MFIFIFIFIFRIANILDHISESHRDMVFCPCHNRPSRGNILMSYHNTCVHYWAAPQLFWISVGNMLVFYSCHSRPSRGNILMSYHNTCVHYGATTIIRLFNFLGLFCKRTLNILMSYHNACVHHWAALQTFGALFQKIPTQIERVRGLCSKRSPGVATYAAY